MPRLFFKSEAGEDLIRLAIGGDEEDFPFDLQDVPHLTLETGQTQLTLAVMPAHEQEGLGEFPGSASLEMGSQEWEPGQVGTAKTMLLSVDTYEADFAVSTMNDDHPLGPMDADVHVQIDVVRSPSCDRMAS